MLRSIIITKSSKKNKFLVEHNRVIQLFILKVDLFDRLTKCVGCLIRLHNIFKPFTINILVSKKKIISVYVLVGLADFVLLFPLVNKSTTASPCSGIGSFIGIKIYPISYVIKQ